MEDTEMASVWSYPTSDEELCSQAVLHAVKYARPGTLAGVEAALSKPGVNINVQDANRRSALSLAILKNRDDIVRLLMQVPGIALWQRDQDGFTPLHLACRYGAMESAFDLLSDEQSAGQVNATDNLGRTPAMLVYLYVRYGDRSAEEVRLNLIRSTDEDLTNRHMKKAKILDAILLIKDFEINMRDDLDRSVFSFAVAMGDEVWARKMLQMGQLQESSLWKELGEICIWETKNRLEKPSDIRVMVQDYLSSLRREKVEISSFLANISDSYKKPEKVRKTKLKRLLRDYIDTSLLDVELIEVFEDKWLYLIVSCISSGDSNFLRMLRDCGLFYRINELTVWELHQIYKMARLESMFIDLPESDKLDDVVTLLGFKPVQQDNNVFGAFHLTFPFVCAILGKLDLVGTFFEITEWNNTIPLGVFIVWILRAILNYKSFSRSKENRVLDLIKAIDSKIALLSETASQRDLKEDDKSVTTIFLSEQVITALGKRTVLQTAIEASCNDFLDLAFCQKHVKSSWLPLVDFKAFVRFREKLWAFVLPFLFIFLYFPLLAFAVIVILLSLPLSLFEICCRHRKTHPENGEKGPPQTLCTLLFSRFITKTVRKCRSRFYKPFVRFLLDGLVHLALLVILSYFVQRDLHYKFAVIEIVIYTLLVGFTLEEIRQIITRIVRSSALWYISDPWNWIDWLFIIFMYAGIGIRIKPYLNSSPCVRTDYYCLDREASDTFLYIARVCFVIGTILCYMKFLRIASYHKNLGPKLRMISEMIVIDLIPFLFILAVFIFAFGTAFSALLFPNSRTGNNTKWQSWDDLKLSEFSIARGFALAFYNMLGDFTILSLTATGCDMKQGYLGIPNEVGAVAVPFGFLVVYVILVNILLLNLLIALFGQTIAVVSDRSRLIWYRFRVDLIEDYYIHSVLPPPLNVFDMVFDLFYCIQRGLRLCWYPNLKFDTDSKRDHRETSCIAAFCYIQSRSSERTMNKVHHDRPLPVQVTRTLGATIPGVLKVMANISSQTECVQTENEPEVSNEPSKREKISKGHLLDEMSKLRQVIEKQQELLLSSNRKLRKLKKIVYVKS